MRMRRNTFGNLILGMFALFLFSLFVNNERFQQGKTATTRSVLTPALYRTALSVGGFVCIALIGLHLSRKFPPS